MVSPVLIGFPQAIEDLVIHGEKIASIATEQALRAGVQRLMSTEYTAISPYMLFPHLSKVSHVFKAVKIMCVSVAVH